MRWNIVFCMYMNSDNVRTCDGFAKVGRSKTITGGNVQRSAPATSADRNPNNCGFPFWAERAHWMIHSEHRFQTHGQPTLNADCWLFVFRECWFKPFVCIKSLLLLHSACVNFSSGVSIYKRGYLIYFMISISTQIHTN